MLKSNPKELSNRVFGGFCLLWTIWILAINVVSLSTNRETAIEWNRISAYALVLLVPSMIHFVLVFPYRSRLIRRRWVVPALYSAAILLLAFVVEQEHLFLRVPEYDFKAKAWGPEFRPNLYFVSTAAFTVATLFLVIRYIFTDLEVTRKRLFFVLFGIATYALYEAIGDLHINADERFKAKFEGPDLDFWRLSLVSDALVILTFFTLLVLLAIRARKPERRSECLILIGSGLGALWTGFFDPIFRSLAADSGYPVVRDYPGVLWIWRIVAVGLMFYAILKYQLFDLNVRIRAGVKYGTMTTAFVAVLFTVQELVKDFAGNALGYFAGLLAAAVVVFLLTPIQRLIERFAHTVVPPTSTETYERYRSMEIYRAALEGALADRIVSPEESHALKNLRDKLGISPADHALLERDIKETVGKSAV